MKEPEFKPKELFCDRDLEYVADNLTSATAILSAFSEEDVAHLGELEETRNRRWKKRREEEEEFAREAERARQALSDEEKTEKGATEAGTGTEATRHRTSLFSSKEIGTRLQPIIVPIKKQTALSPKKESTRREKEGVDTSFSKETLSFGVGANLPLIAGYSSSDEE